MEQELKNKLIGQILRICEKQYRKGYQHGFYASATDNVSLEKVDNWRMAGATEDYKRAVNPETGEKYDPLKRVLPELAMPDMKELERFLTNRLDL